LTADDFLAWLTPGRHADLIDGEVFMHSPVSIPHADLLNFVDGLLRYYIDRHKLGRLYREVVAVRLASRNVFLPDLAFVCTERASIIRENHIDGAPDLVVEVLSNRTADRDVGPKFAAYEEHGVREYWVLDPETLAHRFYRREGDRLDGELLVEYADGEDEIRSAVVSGFFVRREWLDPGRLPSIGDALATLERKER
jgi:Uma2 family endonuclease